MKTYASDTELADVLAEVGHPDAQQVAEHRRPAYEPRTEITPAFVELRLADLSIGEWFARMLKFAIALFLVGLVLSIPVICVNAVFTAFLVTSSTPTSAPR